MFAFLEKIVGLNLPSTSVSIAQDREDILNDPTASASLRKSAMRFGTPQLSSGSSPLPRVATIKEHDYQDFGNFTHDRESLLR